MIGCTSNNYFDKYLFFSVTTRFIYKTAKRKKLIDVEYFNDQTGFTEYQNK